MTALIDLTGQRFGRLTVLDRASNDAGGRARWRVRCDCGEERTVWGQALRRGGTRSCGCLSAEVATARLQTDPRCDPITHGLSGTPEYQALKNARQRCTSPTNPYFADYGGRGIDFRLPAAIGEATALLIAAIGRRPAGMTLDRIDNDGHYEIGNLRWATRTQQQRNRRRDARGRR